MPIALDGSRRTKHQPTQPDEQVELGTEISSRVMTIVDVCFSVTSLVHLALDVVQHDDTTSSPFR